MNVLKCEWFNNHQSPCSLMIDDVVPVAVTVNKRCNPSNDWGYLMNNKNSLYEYLDNYLLKKYPEIKGTIFFPIDSHNYLPKDSGYDILTKEINDEYIEFLRKINTLFEIAFHGVKHAWIDEYNNTIYEFLGYKKDSLKYIAEKIVDFEKKSEIKFSGGKFPGYKYNEEALTFVKEFGFRWWALDNSMINKNINTNKIYYSTNFDIVVLPTNISGDLFKNYYWQNSKRRMLSNFLNLRKISHPVDYIRYLYESKLPLTIQEHFQNQSPRGKRQPINIYDDIWSLDQIFGLLRGLDIWYATCGEIADYYFNYINTSISNIDSSSFEIKSEKPFRPIHISIKTSVARLIYLDENETLQGIRRNNEWVFNNLKCGTYRAL